MALDVGNNRRVFCPKVEPFFEVFPWCYKLLEIVFIMDFSGHFDIWNNLEKNFFFIFPKFIGGTLTILVIIVRVPPMNFGKMQESNFFNLIPDIKMYAQTINKNDFRIFPTQLVSPQ